MLLDGRIFPFMAGTEEDADVKAIVSFVGRHNSGKTELLTRLIPVLQEKGIKLAVIKHAPVKIHLAADTDSNKLFNAGADLVILSSARAVIQYQKNSKERSLPELYEDIPPDYKLVIVEGYKKEDVPKIEVLRRDIDPLPNPEIQRIIARVADFTLEGETIPIFFFQELEQIAAFIIAHFKL